MSFLKFVWSTFFGYWRWAWRVHRGFPIPRGDANHHFKVSVDGPAAKATMTGMCTEREVMRLFAFASMYEVPKVAIYVADGMTLFVDSMVDVAPEMKLDRS